MRARIGVKLPLFPNALVLAKDVAQKDEAIAKTAFDYLRTIGFVDGKGLKMGASLVFNLGDK